MMKILVAALLMTGSSLAVWSQNAPEARAAPEGSKSAERLTADSPKKRIAAATAL